ncbi:hypothetical protein [Amphibacillus jilinensis]|uniref:hypothetical protein n=1 Tax=Amphibacillus jilinensis TaxID=1216008 RepID=UPI0002D89678|nr:hypothetical protein [Amphibacillus jilinensis]
MKNRTLFILGMIFIVGCILFGGFLGIYIIGEETGGYMAIPMIVGTLLGVLITWLITKWSKRRNGNVPNFDERSIILMKRYLMIVLYVLLIGSGATLLILYSMGVYFIETGMLIVCLMTFYFIIGVGAFITKRL